MSRQIKEKQKRSTKTSVITKTKVSFTEKKTYFNETL